MFILMQLIGGGLALAMIRVLYPAVEQPVPVDTAESA
jgi:hypothetical protein